MRFHTANALLEQLLCQKYAKRLTTVSVYHVVKQTLIGRGQYRVSFDTAAGEVKVNSLADFGKITMQR